MLGDQSFRLKQMIIMVLLNYMVLDISSFDEREWNAQSGFKLVSYITPGFRKALFRVSQNQHEADRNL